MAHFARVDDENVVREVVVVANSAIQDLPFPDSEPVGQAMLSQSGFMGIWLQCSYNANFRGAYPGFGWTYDAATDIFVPPPSFDEAS